MTPEQRLEAATKAVIASRLHFGYIASPSEIAEDVRVALAAAGVEYLEGKVEAQSEILANVREHMSVRDAQVKSALNGLRAEYVNSDDPDFSEYKQGVDWAMERLNATIAALFPKEKL